MARGLLFGSVLVLALAPVGLSASPDGAADLSDWTTAQGDALIAVYGRVSGLSLEQQQALLPDLTKHVNDLDSPLRVRAAGILKQFDLRVIPADERDRLAYEVLVQPALSPADDARRVEMAAMARGHYAFSVFWFPPPSEWEGPELVATDVHVVQVVAAMLRPEKYCSELIARCLADGTPSRRALGVYLAAHCDPLVGLPVCQAGSRDQDPYVRFAAVNGAAWIAFSHPDFLAEAQELIVARLADEHEFVRLTADWWSTTIELPRVISDESERNFVETLRLQSFEDRASGCAVLNFFDCRSPAALAAAADVIRDAGELNEYAAGVAEAFVLLARTPQIDERCEQALQAAMQSQMWGDTARMAWFARHGPSADKPWENWRAEIESSQTWDKYCQLPLHAYRKLLASAPGDGELISVVQTLMANEHEPLVADVVGSLADLGWEQAVVEQAARMALESDRPLIALAGAGVLLQLNDKEPRAYDIVRQSLDDEEAETDEPSQRAVELLLQLCNDRPERRSLYGPLLEQVLFDADSRVAVRIPILRTLARNGSGCCECVPLLRRIIDAPANDPHGCLRRTAMRLAGELHLQDEAIDSVLLEATVNGRPAEQAIAREALEALRQ